MEGLVKAGDIGMTGYRKTAAGIVELIDLEMVLENAPTETEYRQGKDGFSLINNEIRMNYCASLGEIDLWFMKLHPIVAINGFCTYTGCPEFEAMDLAVLFPKVGKSPCSEFRVQRGNLLPAVPIGKESHFQYATSLLQKACEKYCVREHIQRFQGQE